MMVVRAVPGRAQRLLEGYFGPSWASFAGIFIVTNLGLLAVGATLPVLPRFVTEELNGSDLEVGIVTGAFAFTGFFCRPIAGNAAELREMLTNLIGSSFWTSNQDRPRGAPGSSPRSGPPGGLGYPDRRRSS